MRRRLRSGCEKVFHLRKELAPRRGAGVWVNRAKDQDWTEIVRGAIVCVRGSGFGHWSPNEPWFGLRRTGCHVLLECPWASEFGSGSQSQGSSLNLVCLAVLGSRLPGQGRRVEVAGSLALLGRKPHRGLIGKGYGLEEEGRMGRERSGERRGSQSPRVCRGPTPSPSWRPSAVPRAVAVQEHSGPRSSECMATPYHGVQGPPRLQEIPFNCTV